jgi:hypothetical protein
MRQRRNRAETKAEVYPNARNASVAFCAPAVAMLLTTTLAVPSYAVLPVVATVALISAALGSIAAHWTTAEDRRLVADLAGACAFIGVAAAIFSRPTQILATAAFIVP